MSKTVITHKSEAHFSGMRLFICINACLFALFMAILFTGCGKSSKYYDQKTAEARASIDAHSFSQAVELLQEGAENGHVQSQALLGISYMMLDREIEGAIWIRKAAEAGDGVSQFNLGKCYALGMGVQQNYKESDHWLEKAKENGAIDTTSFWWKYPPPFKY